MSLSLKHIARCTAIVGFTLSVASPPPAHAGIISHAIVGYAGYKIGRWVERSHHPTPTLLRPQSQPPRRTLSAPTHPILTLPERNPQISSNAATNIPAVGAATGSTVMNYSEQHTRITNTANQNTQQVTSNSTYNTSNTVAPQHETMPSYPAYQRPKCDQPDNYWNKKLQRCVKGENGSNTAHSDNS